MARIHVISDDEVREPGTYEPVAVVRVTRAELLERGVELQTPVADGTWDEAGAIQEALIELASGEQPLLIWHLVFEEHQAETGDQPALELRAPISTPTPREFVARTMTALDLPPERVEWVVADDDWPPFGRHS